MAHNLVIPTNKPDKRDADAKDEENDDDDTTLKIYAEDTLKAIEVYRANVLKGSGFKEYKTREQVQAMDEFTRGRYRNNVARYKLLTDNSNPYKFRNDRAKLNAYMDVLDEPLAETLKSVKVTYEYLSSRLRKLGGEIQKDVDPAPLQHEKREVIVRMKQLAQVSLHGNRLRESINHPAINNCALLPRTKQAHHKDGIIPDNEIASYDEIDMGTISKLLQLPHGIQDRIKRQMTEIVDQELEWYDARQQEEQDDEENKSASDDDMEVLNEDVTFSRNTNNRWTTTATSADTRFVSRKPSSLVKPEHIARDISRTKYISQAR